MARGIVLISRSVGRVLRVEGFGGGARVDKGCHEDVSRDQRAGGRFEGAGDLIFGGVSEEPFALAASSQISRVRGSTGHFSASEESSGRMLNKCSEEREREREENELKESR